MVKRTHLPLPYPGIPLHSQLQSPHSWKHQLLNSQSYFMIWHDCNLANFEPTGMFLKGLPTYQTTRYMHSSIMHVMKLFKTTLVLNHYWFLLFNRAWLFKHIRSHPHQKIEPSCSLINLLLLVSVWRWISDWLCCSVKIYFTRLWIQLCRLPQRFATHSH